MTGHSTIKAIGSRAANDDELEGLRHLMDWLELIQNDLGACISALDRYTMERSAIGKPPTMDFLTASKAAHK